MAIHKKTAERAANLKIALTEGFDIDEQSVFQASYKRGILAEERVFTAPKAKDALDKAALDRTLSLEYPALFLTDELSLEARVKSDSDVGYDPIEIQTYGKLPTLAACLGDAQDADIDPEEGYEDQPPEQTGSVVNGHYKVEYAARGDAANCGDWLALTLDGRFGPKGNFDADAFTAFLVANDVPMEGKWAGLPTSGQKGWIGRYRMNGRQKLETTILTRGTIILDGKPHEVNRQWALLKLESRPKIEPEWDIFESEA